MTPTPQAVHARRFRAIGTDVTVAVMDRACADRAADLVARRLDELDRACSRFRSDAEIARLSEARGTPVLVSELLYRVIENALGVAYMTGGAVDPTVGRAIASLGYDRDFSLLSPPDVGVEDPDPDVPVVVRPTAEPAPGWWAVQLDPVSRTVAVPEGVLLDVGSSAKAFAADEAAAAVVRTLGTGVLVCLGGDVAVAGARPEGGWAVGIACDSATPATEVDQVVAIHTGGIASSAPGVRAWRVGGEIRHHIVDPWTGESAPVHWDLVSVAAPRCVAANALSTAALVWGLDAPDRLAAYRLPARLVRHVDGSVLTLYGWPDEASLDDRDHDERGAAPRVELGLLP